MNPARAERRRERAMKRKAQEVAMRFYGNIKYPPGTIIKRVQWGVVRHINPDRSVPYFVEFENGDIIYYTEDGINNGLSSRSQYKKDVRRRRKAGIQVNSLI